MNAQEKLTALRAAMKERGIDAYLVHNADPHASGYMAPYWKARAWFTGFTGSAGLAVVTATEAGLWTDGRYFLQAEKQLEGSGIKLFKLDVPGVPTVHKFLADVLPEGGKLGFDGRVVNLSEFKSLKEALQEKSISYETNDDLVGDLWKDRPGLPSAPAFEHELCFAGASAADKLAVVREKMQVNKVTAYLVNALDSIAWLMNIRGSDISFTPVVYAYVLVTLDKAYVFIDRSKVAAFAANLETQGFEICEYDEVASFLAKLPADGCLLYDANRVSILLAEAVNTPVHDGLEVDIITALKAVRSPVELENVQAAYLKEGVVLTRLIKWIKQHPDIGSLTEGDIARKITSLRQEQEHFLEDGFSTIAAYGANGAQAHYSPGPVGDRLKPEGFLLVDTGGQYLDGTTDTTRTIPIGPISDEMKRDYTLVLKGYMALTRAVFPKGTAGSQLDVLARLPLWELGLDYRHGTGHGIGYCLAVHEGPQGIHKRSKVALEPGMMLSNEPAYYVDGKYGIRTENIIVVEERIETGYGTYYGFRPLMYCPIDTTAIDMSLLSDDEVAYFNEYHRMTYEKIAPRLNEEEARWLQEATQPI